GVFRNDRELTRPGVDAARDRPPDGRPHVHHGGVFAGALGSDENESRDGQRGLAHGSDRNRPPTTPLARRRLSEHAFRAAGTPGRAPSGSVSGPRPNFFRGLGMPGPPWRYRSFEPASAAGRTG